MRPTPARAATATLTAALAIVLLLAGCGDGVGPGDPVLVGQFGAKDYPAELLATHAGVEVAIPCSYFSAERPAALEADGTFRVRGAWYHYGFTVGDRRQESTLTGTLVPGDVDAVNLTFVPDGAGTVDAIVLTLRRSEHYAGEPVACGV
jgi:hypothetical protein